MLKLYILLSNREMFPGIKFPVMKHAFRALIAFISITSLHLAGTTASAQLLTSLQVHFIDVGHGDAILIDNGTTEVLIDGGYQYSKTSSYIANYVDGNLEAMVATHPHADHIGGLVDVLNMFQVDKIFWNGELNQQAQTDDDFINAANNEPNSTLEVITRGNSINVGNLIFLALNPPDIFFSGTDDDLNNNSIALKFTYGEVNFLFMADAQYAAESQLIADDFNVDADILKVGHHGSNDSSSLSFLKKVSPETAIYSANGESHPHPDTITRLKQTGAVIYGTDVNGTIVISTDGEGYSVSAEREVYSLTIDQVGNGTTSPSSGIHQYGILIKNVCF
jgi:beta-lactamase superfamily II metal-dependent hydrolase